VTTVKARRSELEGNAVESSVESISRVSVDIAAAAGWA
jgi:hypothetical protein